MDKCFINEVLSYLANSLANTCSFKMCCAFRSNNSEQVDVRRCETWVDDLEAGYSLPIVAACFRHLLYV